MSSKKQEVYTVNKPALMALVVCRVFIGWHFLYEGFVKLINPNWSAKWYLLDSKGLLSDFFLWIANNETAVTITNNLNKWGLILIGLSFILGLFSKASSIAGIILLALFYASHPPLLGAKYMLPTEGSYLIVDKNLIEIAILVVLMLIPTSRFIGIDRLILKDRKQHHGR